MKRREFLRTGVPGAAVAALVPATAVLGASGIKNSNNRKKPELRLAMQERIIPGDMLDAKLDFLEKHGFSGIEPGGTGLPDRINEFQQALRSRKVKVCAVTSGFKGYMLTTNPKEKENFDNTFRDILIAAGELGAAGVVMVPVQNRHRDAMPYNMETREYLVQQMKEWGDFALTHETTVILEPLKREYAYFIRLVADAAAICRDAGSNGARCLGDFYHMYEEETSNYGAFWSGSKYLKHVHIASMVKRQMPGEEPEIDDYRDGFRALQELNYQGHISFECGTGSDPLVTIPAAVKWLKWQWDSV